MSAKLDLSDFGEEECDPSPAVAFDTVDIRQWPLVEIKVVRAPVNDKEIDDFQARFMTVLGHAEAKGVKLFLMFNMDGIVQASFSQKLRARQFIQAVRKSAETTIHATALVTTSTLARVVLMAVIALQPLVSLNRIFDANEPALTWLRTNQARVEAGLPVVFDA